MMQRPDRCTGAIAGIKGAVITFHDSHASIHTLTSVLHVKNYGRLEKAGVTTKTSTQVVIFLANWLDYRSPWP